MHISHLVIKNFRALADIDCDLSPRVNVVVGPNAVGKTTILQAIRLAKAIMAPRTQTETQMVFVSLNAASPHFPNQFFLSSLARDPSLPVEVRCRYILTDHEIETLRTSLPELVKNIVAARMGLNFTNQIALIQFLQSTQGQGAISTTTNEISEALKNLKSDGSILVGVKIEQNNIVADFPLGGLLIGFLDRRLPPSSSIFSYFPADRALPMGEVNLQLGAPDAQQQLESHNSQPQLKYARLKNLIINSLIIGESDQHSVRSEFEKIFSGLLRGRRIKTINVNQHGLLSILTEEMATDRVIELDSLSSGEKNIALTFLLVARTVADGGVVLFDEPELHLNPAVSREVLPFILENYSKPRNIQFIMCTHSPEILSGAFRNEDCALLHLKSASDITPVGKRALDEYSDALGRLGTSVSEVLLCEGTVLVEGADDVAFLESGFPEILKKYKVKDVGGRREVEKTIIEIQKLETSTQKVTPIYLIFDRDKEPTGLRSSATVKVLQWPRYCIENYMIDLDVISSLLADSAITREPIKSAGEVNSLLKKLALHQLDEIAARDIYNSYGFLNASLTKSDVETGGIEKISVALYERMSRARVSIPEVTRDAWISAFKRSAEQRKDALLPKWEAKWKEICDGKRLISDLHKAANVKLSEASFKLRISQKMRDISSTTWSELRDILDKFIAS